MDLDQICFTGKPERIGKNRQCAKQFPSGAVFVAGGIDSGVREVANESMLVGASQPFGEF